MFDLLQCQLLFNIAASISRFQKQSLRQLDWFDCANVDSVSPTEFFNNIEMSAKIPLSKINLRMDLFSSDYHRFGDLSISSSTEPIVGEYRNLTKNADFYGKNLGSRTYVR